MEYVDILTTVEHDTVTVAKTDVAVSLSGTPMRQNQKVMIVT